MSEMTREDDGEQPHVEANSILEIDHLMRSLGEDVNISNSPRRPGLKKRAAKPAKSPSSLTVSPPPRDSSTFLQPQQQQQQQQSIPSLTPLFDTSIFMPSPTAFRILQSPQPVDSHGLNLPNTSSSNLTQNQSMQLTAAPFDHLRSSNSDLVEPLPEYPWFPAPQVAQPVTSNFSALVQLLNLSPVATKVGERPLPILSTYSDGTVPMPASPRTSPKAMSNQNGFLGQGRSPSPTPSLLGDASPLNSPLTSTPNSPLDSPLDSPFGCEGGYVSDGGNLLEIVGVLESNTSSAKRKTPDRTLDESDDIQPPDEPDPKKQTTQKEKKGAVKLNKRVRVPRYAIQTRSEIEVMEDGYKWRKYGQKAVKDSPYPRSYFRCTNRTCPVRKRVERKAGDAGLVVTTYEGTHNHLSPVTEAATVAAASSKGSDVSNATVSEDSRAVASTCFPFQPIQERSMFDLSMQIQAGEIDLEGADRDLAPLTKSSDEESQRPPGELLTHTSLSRDSHLLNDPQAQNQAQLDPERLLELQGEISASVAIPDLQLGRSQLEMFDLSGQLSNTESYVSLLGDIFQNSGPPHHL